MSSTPYQINRLKPCPFCGWADINDDDDVRRNTVTRTVHVVCPRCDARGPSVSIMNGGEDEFRLAAQQWERRGRQ